MSEQPLLRPEEVTTVLSGTGAARAGENAAMPYSLREPAAIPASAEPAARERLGALVDALSAAIERETENDAGLTFEGFQQQRAAAALAIVPEPAWVVSFTSPRGGVALLLDPAAGLGLVERLLGGTSGRTGDPRPPTALESRVLARLAGSCAKALGERLGIAFAAEPVAVAALPQGLAAPGETVGVGLLKVTVSGEQLGAVVLAAAQLLGVTGSSDVAPAAAGATGPLARKLEAVPITIRLALPGGRVPLSSLQELSPGAVLRLDASPGDLFELRVAGATVFTGSVEKRTEGTVLAVHARRGRSPVADKESS